MPELSMLQARPKPQTQDEILSRYPCLAGHMICESLGYFTPKHAAYALLDYINGQPHFCEWYDHMARGSGDKEKLLEIGRNVVKNAFSRRHHHHGYMSHYPLAKELVKAEMKGKCPILASWF